MRDEYPAYGRESAPIGDGSCQSLMYVAEWRVTDALQTDSENRLCVLFGRDIISEDPAGKAAVRRYPSFSVLGGRMGTLLPAGNVRFREAECR